MGDSIPPVSQCRAAVARGAHRSLLTLIFLLPAVPATAATVTVNSLADGAPAADAVCTLREAVASINAGADANGCVADISVNAYGSSDTVIFSVTGTIQLAAAQGHIEITEPIVITGPGPDDLTIRGNNTATAPGFEHRIFFISNDSSPSTLSGLTLTGGHALAGGGGGAVRSESALTLTDCVVSDNTTTVDAAG